MNRPLRSHAPLLLALALTAAALGCNKTRACKQGTALLDLRFTAPAQAGDRVDLTIDVTDTPHETITGSLALSDGTRGGTAEIDFKNPYRAGAHVTLLARVMRGDAIVEELSATATLASGCSRILLQSGASSDAGADTATGDGAVDRVYVEVGGEGGACPGSCSPGESVACGKCGTKTCGTDCTWGACSGEGDCLAGSTQACGNCGIQVCDTTCHWGATCQGGGACKPGDSMPCGNCGIQTCSATCAWGTCAGDSACTPGTTRTCGKCGTEMCSSSGTSCGWSGVCTGEGACSPGSTRPCGTGNCGTEACGNDCQWTGVCQNPGECVPGALGGCGACGTFTCGVDCHWPTDPTLCTGQGVCVPGATAGCGNCGTVTCTTSCQWSTTCDGQGACAPGDTIDCGSCATGIETCSSSCTWGLCKGGTVGCCLTPLTDNPDLIAAPICP
jgi:hypothetical protein